MESHYVALTHCDVGKKWLAHVTFQNTLSIKKSHSPSNYVELTGASNEKIIYTLLDIFKYRYSTKETNK